MAPGCFYPGGGGCRAGSHQQVPPHSTLGGGTRGRAVGSEPMIANRNQKEEKKGEKMRKIKGRGQPLQHLPELLGCGWDLGTVWAGEWGWDGFGDGVDMGTGCIWGWIWGWDRVGDRMDMGTYPSGHIRDGYWDRVGVDVDRGWIWGQDGCGDGYWDGMGWMGVWDGCRDGMDVDGGMAWTRTWGWDGRGDGDGGAGMDVGLGRMRTWARDGAGMPMGTATRMG